MPPVAGPGVLVLGMHRSGTSALTRVLGLLGLETGASQTLMGAAPSNRSGHWEITPLTECNDRLLREVGGRWSGPPAGGDVGRLATGPLGAEARQRFRAALTSSPWTWKDPRLCLTLPFWQEVLGGRPPAVVCLRHPLEVAESLRERNGFSLSYGLALWERYARCLWANMAGTPALVVDYATALDDRDALVGRLADFVEHHAGLAPDADARAQAVASLDGRQRHHHAGDPAARGDDRMSAEQWELFQSMQALVGDQAVLPAPDLGPETAGLQLAFDEHSRMAEFEDEVLRLRAGIEQVRAEARADLDRQTLFFHQELERRSAEASTLATDVMAARDQIEALQASLERIRSRFPVRAYLAARRRLPGGHR